jgi:class 3 adenylate cyclase/pimeloyl-ACP methyl ester carboxylesterase
VTASGETRYAKAADGGHIAYRVRGDGPLDLVVVLGANTHLEHELTEPSMVRWESRLESFARVIRFDKRGSGLSDRAVGPLTLEARMEDIGAVMDAAGSERAVIFGASEGGSLACMFAATHPERTLALVLYGAVVKWFATPDFPWTWPSEILDWVIDETERNFGQGPPLHLWAPSVADDPSVQQWWGQHERLSSSPGSIRAMMEQNRLTDIRPILPTINVPSLVLHREGDMIVNVGQGQYLGRTIPGAKYVEFPGNDHFSFYGDMDVLADEIEEFLTGQRHERQVDRVLATVLFTDVVGSTEHAVRLGDRRWRDLLSRHNHVVRDQLGRFRGREVSTTGDGFLATFDGPARAIRCASAIRDGVSSLGIEIRAGIHAGEVELIGDDVAGIAVHIGARVGAAAGPNEVLVSRTVADLVAGSGAVFEDRGVHKLKGVPGEWQLLAVAHG